MKHRWGYVRHGRGWLLNHKLRPPRVSGRLIPVAQVDYYLDLVRAAGCGDSSRRLELAVTGNESRSAARLWQRLGIPENARVVAFNPGGQYGSSKHWPTENFAELARLIVDHTGAEILVLCGPGERAVAREIQQRARPCRVHSLADEQVGIGLSKACVQRSSLLVTTDSGPRHFAAALGVPVVTLFGSKDPAWSETYFEKATHMRLELACVPCGRRRCPLKHHQCMRDMTAEMVFAAAKKHLPEHEWESV